MKSSCPRYLSVILLFTALINFTVFSQNNPLTPLNFNAVVVDLGNEQQAVRLTWTLNPDGPKPNYFYIYKADTATTVFDELSFLKEVKISGNKTDYESMITNLSAGTYSFAITSVIKEGGSARQSNPTEILNVQIQEEAYVRITSTPLTTVSVGEEYSYQVTIESNINSPVDFELISAPNGMSIQNGTITWTPASAGMEHVTLRASLQSNPSVNDVQSFNISVQGENYFVKINSKADNFATKGNEYTYQVITETNSDSTIIYELTESPDGMAIDVINGLITWTPTEAGVFHAEVRAYLESDSSVDDKQKFTVQVREEEKYYIRITSKAENFARINNQYTYQVTVETNSDEPIIYSLAQAPNGMTIDEQGTISWLPEFIGKFQIEVIAALDSAKKISDKQKYMLQVLSDSSLTECVYIRGTVEGEDSKPVSDGQVIAWRVDKGMNSDKDKPIYKTDISDGQFSLFVAEGTYSLHLQGGTIIGEWYEDAETLKDATKLIAECNNDINVEIKVTLSPSPSTFTISGTVTSESDGASAAAMVEFMPVDWLYNSNQGKPKKWKYIAETDTDGKYSIDLSDEFTYTAHAIPKSTTGLADQYYNNTSDPTEAVLIELDQNLEGINFILKTKSEVNNGFSGIVTDENGTGIKSTLIAYLINARDDKTWTYIYNQSVESGDDGTFSLTNLIPGEYVLLSIPFDKTLGTGYYREDDFVSLKWKEAFRITVGDEFLQEEFIVKHKECGDITGAGKLQGKIKKNKGKIELKKPNPLSDEDALPGALINVLNGSHTVADYTFTDQYGEFDFFGLKPGQYTVIADKVGYEPLERILDIDYEQNPLIELDLEMEQEPSDIQEMKFENGELLIYPSPAESYINLKVNNIQGEAIIKIFNGLGSLVSNRKMEKNDGENILSLNVEYLPSGIYFITISNGIENYKGKFSILK